MKDGWVLSLLEKLSQMLTTKLNNDKLQKKKNAVKEVIDKTVLKRWFKNVKI